jgi:hypothetical protein
MDIPKVHYTLINHCYTVCIRYLGALGAAAEVGVDVFCRESLAGDWLEVIGLWQPGDARTGEHNRAYTPHPDFWVAALWSKLMGIDVLGTNQTNQTLTAAAPMESMERAGSSCDNALESCAPTLRTFAHCSKRVPGAIAFAVAVSPCTRTEALVLRFVGARTLTTYMLTSADSAGQDTIKLNGQNLTVSTGNVPTLQGRVVAGDTVVVPAEGECAVGFVEAEYAQPAAACM